MNYLAMSPVFDKNSVSSDVFGMTDLTSHAFSTSVRVKSANRSGEILTTKFSCLFSQW